MPKPGELVIVDFPGAMGLKRRPGVVVSSDLYHAERPDVIVGVVTSNVNAATGSTDYVLKDWAVAGLRVPSSFRAYFATHLQTSVRRIGRLSDRDWAEVRARILLALG
jgi:mRNA interferase MazF